MKFLPVILLFIPLLSVAAKPDTIPANEDNSNVRNEQARGKSGDAPGRAGGKPGKVTLCHFYSVEGVDENGAVTMKEQARIINVSARAAKKHFDNHGDFAIDSEEALQSCLEYMDDDEGMSDDEGSEGEDTKDEEVAVSDGT